MKSDERYNNANHNGRAADNLDAALEREEPLAAALMADGSCWRVERGEPARAIEQRLWASLQAWGDESDDFTVTVMGDDGSVNEMGAGDERAIRTREPEAPIRQRRRYLARVAGRRRPPTWVAVVAAAVTLIGVIGSLFAIHGGAQVSDGRPPSSRSFPPPTYMTWSPAAADGSVTPQQALARGLRMTPCLRDPGATLQRGAPPKTTAITWLFARPDYGIVNIQVTCQTQARPVYLWLLAMARDAAGRWGIESGSHFRNQNPLQTDKHAVPVWLKLPSDSYDRENVLGPYSMSSGGQAFAAVVAWLSQTRMYFLGHVSTSEPRPDGAIKLSVNGRAGWEVQQGGMVTVTLPLADGSTAFFSGTDSLSEIEALAPVALAHLNEELAIISPSHRGNDDFLF